MGKHAVWLEDLKPGGLPHRTVSMLMHTLIVQNVYSIEALTPYHSASFKEEIEVRKGQEEKKWKSQFSRVTRSA